MRKTYITTMPDKAGAFLKASRAIAAHGGNIVRVNYNKAVDMHTLFLEVSAQADELAGISAELEALGYLADQPENRVILIVLTLPDVAGAVTPVLEVLSRYDINISYISSQENGTPCQHFKMGLLIENPAVIKQLLDEVSRLCEVKVLEYEVTEKALDNTVFYLTFASQMRSLLSLSQEETNAVTIQANRIMQILDERDEAPLKTFDYIRRFAEFLVNYRGEQFCAQVSRRSLGPGLELFTIEPPCGSNTYILSHGSRLLFVDCGFACFRREMEAIFRRLFPRFAEMEKSLFLTHGDIDHAGLLDLFDRVYVSQSCFENFRLEGEGRPNFREQNPLHAPYCLLSKILSGYRPPDLSPMQILGERQGEGLLEPIGGLDFGGFHFDALEGPGGHVRGETVLLCRELRLAFTGDIVVNIQGFSEPQRRFNLLAPYLMTSVNVNSRQATLCREELLRRLAGYTLCPGHGAIMDAPPV